MEIYRYAVVEGDIILFVPGRTSSIKITIQKITKKLLQMALLQGYQLEKLYLKPRQWYIK